MFRRLLHDLGPGRVSLPTLPWEINNAMTESALLHARQLADILLSRTDEPTDIKLKDILPGFQPTRLEELRRIYGNNRGGICQTLNKCAMHPSTSRVDTSVLQQLGPIIEGIVSEIELRKGSKAFEWTGGGKLKLPANVNASTNVPTVIEHRL